MRIVRNVPLRGGNDMSPQGGMSDVTILQWDVEAGEGADAGADAGRVGVNAESCSSN